MSPIAPWMATGKCRGNPRDRHTEAQWRAVLQRLSLRFRLGDRVDSNASAMPSGGARPPRAVAGNDCF